MPVIGPSTTRTYLRYFFEFTVGVGVGLAPFLGLKKVPGFVAVIEIYPIDLREWLVPLSAIMMGMIAVIVQWFSSNKPAKKSLTRLFVGSVAAFFLSLTLLALVVYPFVVTRIEKFAVVTGSLDVPRQPPGSRCTCTEGQPADQCLADITLNPINVRSCFGTKPVAIATLELAALYLMLTGSFAAAVALVVLSDLRKPKQSRRK